MLKKLIQAWLGGRSVTPANVLGLTDILEAMRTAVVVALIVGGIAAVEDFNGQDWGILEGIVDSALVGVVEVLRRYLKDYQS